MASLGGLGVAQSVGVAECREDIEFLSSSALENCTPSQEVLDLGGAEEAAHADTFSFGVILWYLVRREEKRRRRKFEAEASEWRLQKRHKEGGCCSSPTRVVVPF